MGGGITDHFIKKGKKRICRKIKDDKLEKTEINVKNKKRVCEQLVVEKNKKVKKSGIIVEKK